MMLLERVAGAVSVSISFTEVFNTLEADSQGASQLTRSRRSLSLFGDRYGCGGRAIKAGTTVGSGYALRMNRLLD